MRFAKGAARLIRSAGLEPASAGLLLQRIEDAVPHLHFGPWHSKKEPNNEPENEGGRGEARWSDRSRRGIDVVVRFSNRTLSSRVSLDGNTVAVDDHRFLGFLATEAAWILNGGLTRPILVSDFGIESVAGEIFELLKFKYSSFEFDPLPLLHFVRSLSQETYENQRLSYGLILTPRQGGGVSLASAAGNKRFKRLTDGFSTALLLDCEGRLLEIVALDVPASEGVARKRRPLWVANVAQTADAYGGIGIALTRNGDILITHRARLLFTRRAGKWSKWNHAAILNRLGKLFDHSVDQPRSSDVLSYLYHVALDLAFHRSGGLLVILGSKTHLEKLLASRDDRLTSPRRREPERSLDSALAKRTISGIDRRVLADLASLDGAVVVDRTGQLLAYGAMTRSSSAAKQGARTRAAYGASRHGLAIKVSSDGDIQFYRKGRKEFEI